MLKILSIWLIEGDAEAEWLKRIGLGSIVSQIESMHAYNVCMYSAAGV